MQAGIPVVQVAICGARRVIGRAVGWRPMVASRCAVVVGRPVPTAGLTYADRDVFCAGVQRVVRALPPPPHLLPYHPIPTSRAELGEEYALPPFPAFLTSLPGRRPLPLLSDCKGGGQHSLWEPLSPA